MEVPMPTPISFAATGDSFITRRLPATPELAAIRALLAACDARFTNVETLTPGPGAIANAISGGTWASAPDGVIPDLQALGFNMFALATNHALDFLHAGLTATGAAFDRYDAVVAGAGANLAEATAPRYLETPAGRVAVISVCSTLHETAIAGQQRVDMPGRPGINPLRFATTYTLPRAELDALAALAATSNVNSRNHMMVKEGHAEPPPAGVIQFGDLRFREGPAGGVITTARPDDVARVTAAISEARRQADRVVVSLHAHEQLGEDKAIAADFVEAFCRACIDEGAHAVIGHGPHVLRGIEIYCGRPIFYSLGNFIFQNETVPVLPQEFYDKFKLPLDARVPDAIDARSDTNRRGFAANPWAWKAVIARWVDDGDRVSEITLHPVALGYGEGRPQRGLPQLSDDPAILPHLADLSARYGTRLEMEGGVGRILK
jgi:poly-gamma-glutamate capsule biosynthesis protein CapA/YwtB (metallophosphatase superfamily)